MMTGRGSRSRGRGSRGLGRGSRGLGRGSRGLGRGSRGLGRGSRGRGRGSLGRDSSEERVPIISCCVPNCKSSLLTKAEDSFFKIPKDQRREIWLQLINRMDLIHSNPHVVCEDHFKEDNFVFRKERKRLSYSALPMEKIDELGVVEGNTTNNDRDKSTQTNYEEMVSSTITDAYDSNDTSRPIYDQTVEQEINTLFDTCNRLSNVDVAELLKAQISLKVAGSGNINDINYLILCLNFYYKSPEIYRLLETSLNLPNPKSYNGNIFSMKSGSERNQHAMALFKIKVENMCLRERNCVVLADFIKLKQGYFRVENCNPIGLEDINGVCSRKLAKMALVIMVRGLYVDWEQPVGFAFLETSFELADKITEFIDNQITVLIGYGLEVKALVLNSESVLHNSKIPGQTHSSNKNYFMVNNRQIYYIYDVQQIYLKLRRLFVTFDIKFNDKIAKIDDVIKFYNLDKSKFHRLAPELTQNLLESPIISMPVIAGMSRYIDLNLLDESVRDTVDILMTFNKLYDCLNSKKGEANPHRRPLQQTQQIKFLCEMIDFINRLFFVNKINGFAIVCSMNIIITLRKTIQSVVCLFNDITNEGDLNYLPTGTLNLKPINDFNTNLCVEFHTHLPNAEHFISGFHKLFFENIMKPPVGTAMKDESDDEEEKINTVFRVHDHAKEKLSTEMFDFCEYINWKCHELS